MKTYRPQVFLKDEFIAGFHCKFWLDPDGRGGNFRFPVPEDPYGKCVIGGDEDTWWKVVAILLHECHEFALTARGLRYRETCGLGDGSSNTKFFCTHDELADTHFNTTGAMATVLPALSAAWKKARKGKK